MDFGYDARTLDLRERLLAFMDERVYPAEAVFAGQAEAAARDGRPWDRVPVTEELKAEARRRGLWNLFLTGKAADAVRKLDAEHGTASLPDPPLTNLRYAPLAEVTGRSPALAPEALNCAAPDTGNMELLAEFGSPDQQERWLRPLLDGTIRSAFCMTEPAVASSDAMNIATTITPAR
jgi:acyl-CoA dehydrogenase